MKITKYLAVLTVFLAFGAIAASEVTAQSILSDILRRMDMNNKGLKSLKSDIKMSKHNSQLDEYDVYEGTVQYLPAATREKIKARIDWAKPAVEHLAVGGGEYILYRPRLEQAIIGKVNGTAGPAGAGGALAFLSMSRDQLRANYDVTYQGEATVNGSVKTWHLKLTPKGATSYKTAELWVDKDGMPVQAKVIEKNNDSTTIQLSNVERNATLRSEVFALKPPKGTKIVKG